MQGIKTRLHQEGGTWVEEFPNVLWAHRTTPQTSNEETPFSLAYGTEEVIPAKIGIPTRRVIQESDERNEEALRLNLNLLEERRKIATISLETASPTLHDAVTTHLVMASQHFMTASACTDSHADLENSTYDGVTIKT
ncbi:reverse transcriptase domain-containing protein [Tanacetum coccineum]